MKKIIALLLTMTLVLALTGCVAEEIDIKFETDGSAVVKASVYMADDALEAMGTTPEEVFSSDDGKPVEIITKTFNGRKYSGVSESLAASSISELNKYFVDDESSIATMVFSEKIQNGKHLVVLSGSIPSNKEIAEENASGTEISTEDMQNILILNLSITYPDGVVVVDGIDKNSYSINGNTVTVNIVSENESNYYYLSGSLGNADVTSGLENFKRLKKYNSNFKDVPSSEWYAESVAKMYELGIVSGINDTQFNPNSNLSLSQVIAIAARVNATYNGCADTAFKGNSSEAWYIPYVLYTYDNKIITKGMFGEDKDFKVLDRDATRAEMAYIITKCLPESEYSKAVAYSGFSDVDSKNPYADAIKQLYETGITAGIGDNKFGPNDKLTRSQTVVFFDRLLSKVK